MLPKSKRLTKEDFTATRPKIVFRGELFDIAVVSLPSQKFGCVISKKTLKKAVERNLVKRRIFAILETINLEVNSSFIIYPKKTSLTAPYSHLKNTLEQVFVTLH
jgi:ribonuclease P protein component